MRSRPQRVSAVAAWTFAALAVQATSTVAEEAGLAPAAPIAQQLTAHDALLFKFTNNPEPDHRIHLRGFSVQPPIGDNWIEGPRLPDPDPTKIEQQTALQFIKIVAQRPELGPHTILAFVRVQYLTPDDRAAARRSAVDYMRYRLRMWQAVQRAGPAGRFTVESESAKIETSLGSACARYDAVIEDRGVSGFLGKPFTIRGSTFECLAPSQDYLVTLDYSQRVPPGVDEVDIRPAGEAFLRSLQFAAGPVQSKF